MVTAGSGNRWNAEQAGAPTGDRTLHCVSGTDDSTPRLLRDLDIAHAHVDLAVRQKLGVSATDYLALKHLVAHREPIGPVGLGKLLGISSGSATGLVDRLERDGHVERRRHPDDRRRQTLTVSAGTADVITAELRPLADALAVVESTFTRGERDAIVRFLSGVLTVHRGMFA